MNPSEENTKFILCERAASLENPETFLKEP
jgi:hypothetical protein